MKSPQRVNTNVDSHPRAAATESLCAMAALPTTTFADSFGCARGVRGRSDGDELGDDDFWWRGGVASLTASRAHFLLVPTVAHSDDMVVSAAWCSALSVKPNHAVRVGPLLNCAIIAAATGHALARWTHVTAMANAATKQRALHVAVGVATPRDSRDQKYVADYVCPELSRNRYGMVDGGRAITT